MSPQIRASKTIQEEPVPLSDYIKAINFAAPSQTRHTGGCPHSPANLHPASHIVTVPHEERQLSFHALNPRTVHIPTPLLAWLITATYHVHCLRTHILVVPSRHIPFLYDFLRRNGANREWAAP